MNRFDELRREIDERADLAEALRILDACALRHGFEVELRDLEDA